MKTGIVIETNAEYHEDKSAISKSRLEKMSICPKYFKWYEDNPPAKTPDLILGSAFHKIVLEPETFDEEFAVMPENIDRRSASGKQAYAEFEANAVGKQVISAEQYNQICRMRDEIFSSKKAVMCLTGEHEQSMYGVDEATGERIKTRPDCYRFIEYIDDDGVIVRKLFISDLKSCRSIKYEAIQRDVVNYGYDLQAYMYCYNASKIFNMPMEDISFTFIFVEKSEPCLSLVLDCDEFVLGLGETKYRDYISLYHECKETDNWYGLNGPDDEIGVLSLPSYLLKNI